MTLGDPSAAPPPVYGDWETGADLTRAARHSRLIAGPLGRRAEHADGVAA